MQTTSPLISEEKDARAGLAAKVRAHQLPIVVRMKFGEELFGMKVFEDGVTFHAPSPIPVGKAVELILCSGAIVVDAEIIKCEPIIEALGGFAVRARYCQPSPAMRALITEELTRHLAMEEGAGGA